jgi:hypothetical protein
MLISCLFTLTTPAIAQTPAVLGDQVITFDDHGSWQLLDNQGRQIASATTLFYAKGWRTTSQNQPSITKTGELVWAGEMIDNASKIKSTFTQTVTITDDAVSIQIKVVPQGNIPVEDTPMVVLKLPQTLHDGQTLSIGKTYTLPANNKWGYGGNIKLGLTGNIINLNHPSSMSVWKRGNADNGSYEVRVRLEGPKRGDDKTISGNYEMTLTLQKVTSQAANANTNQPVAFVGQVDVIDSGKKKELTQTRDAQAEYLSNYHRVLNEPTSARFDHTIAHHWIKQGLALRSQNQSADKQVDQVENYLQCLSLAYDLDARQQHLSLFKQLVGKLDSSSFDTSFKQVLDQLKSGQLEGLLDRCLLSLKLAENLDKQAVSGYGSSYYPGQSTNLHSWVKALYLNGYQKHRDGLNAGEPYPWQIAWDAGLSLSLGGSPTDYAVDRTWTTNTWHHNTTGIDVFFSVLTPVTLIEQASELTFDQLNSPVTHLLTPDKKLSMLIGKSQPITFPQLSDNWFAMRTGKGVLLCFTGKQPTTLQNANNRIKLKWGDKTYLAILNLPSSMGTDDLIKQAQFWQNIVTALPMQAVELTADNKIEYRYQYRMQTDAWDTNPNFISPIPQLAVIAVDSSFQSHALTGSHIFSYLPGQSASWSTQNIHKQAMYRGLNDDAKHLIKPGRAQQWVDMGATCVRVCIYHQEQDQTGYDLIQGALEQCHKAGLKALIDPHDFIYMTTRNGLPREADAPEKFAGMWEKLASVSQQYPGTVIGYDLYNELRLKTEEWDTWQPIAEKAIARIRSIDKTTPIYAGCTDMSNATGYHATKKLSDHNAIYSFHHYAMHSFTHQNIFRHVPREAYVFYPGWTPMIDWGAKQTYGDAELLWWDRWSMPASIWPALKFAAQNKVNLHCGEFAPVGWSKPRAAQASMLWTIDAMDMLEQRNIVWHLWNKGFGLTIDEVKDKVTQVWQERNKPYTAPTHQN